MWHPNGTGHLFPNSEVFKCKIPLKICCFCMYNWTANWTKGEKYHHIHLLRKVTNIPCWTEWACTSESSSMTPRSTAATSWCNIKQRHILPTASTQDVSGMILTISSSKIKISVHAMKAHDRVATAPLIQNFGATGRMFDFMPQLLYHRWKNPQVTIKKKAGWSPQLFRMFWGRSPCPLPAIEPQFPGCSTYN